MSKDISGTTERIFTKFSVFDRAMQGLDKLAFIWRLPKGRCHGNQLKSQSRHFLRKKFSLYAAILKRIGLEYRNDDGQLRNALNMATSCTNMVRFGAVTPENRLLIFCTSVKKIAKMGVSDRLSQNKFD